MQQKIRNLSALLIIAGSLLMPATVAAKEAASSTSHSSVSASTSKSSGSDDSAELEDDSTTEVEIHNKSIDDRISHFKTSFKVNLSLAEAARIKLRCVQAQTLVGTLSTRFGSDATPRTKAYTALQTNLSALVTKLKAKSVDTATLEQQITTLNTKITTFNSDLTAYKQALADLKTVSCKTDPAGFQAALLAARSAHETLVADVLAVRTYLVSTIKPTLQTIKLQLASKASTSSEGSN